MRHIRTRFVFPFRHDLCIVGSMYMLSSLKSDVEKGSSFFLGGVSRFRRRAWRCMGRKKISKFPHRSCDCLLLDNLFFKETINSLQWPQKRRTRSARVCDFLLKVNHVNYIILIENQLPPPPLSLLQIFPTRNRKRLL